jgi:WD40 repeat protein
MRKAMFFLLLFTSAISGQKFEPVPKNPQEIVRFKQTFSLSNGDSTIASRLIDSQDRLLIIGEQKVQIRDVQNAQILDSFANKIPKIDSLVRFHTISPEGQRIISLDPADNRLTNIRKILSKRKKLPAIVWNLKTASQLAVLEGNFKSIRTATWSDNGKTLVTISRSFYAGEDKETEICFWDDETYAKRDCALIDGYLGWNYLSRDGKRFFAALEISGYGATGGWIKIWDTEKAKFLHQFEAPGGIWGYNNNFISADEHFFATQSQKSIEIWELDNFSRKFQINLPRKSSWISFGSFSPDEKYVAVKNGKSGTEIYETADGELKFKIPQNESVPEIWADDGKVLINNYCGNASAYSLETSNLLYQLKLVCKTTTDLVSSSIDDEDRIILHPNTRYFLTKSGTAVRIWNSATGELLQTIVNPAQEIEKRKNPRPDDKIKGRTCFGQTTENIYTSPATTKNQFCNTNLPETKISPKIFCKKVFALRSKTH